jgi:hypothetical protein
MNVPAAFTRTVPLTMISRFSVAEVDAAVTTTEVAAVAEIEETVLRTFPVVVLASAT